MDSLFSVFTAVVLILLGVFWEPKPKTRKDLKAEQATLPPDVLAEQPTDAKALTPLQQRNYIRRVTMRLLIIGLGVVALLVALIKGIGSISDTSAFGLLLLLYGGTLLVVQRAEKASRILVLDIMIFIWVLIWRTAEYREYPGENNWALLAAPLTNLVFWYLIGRQFPPGSSDSIEVLGKE